MHEGQGFGLPEDKRGEPSYDHFASHRRPALLCRNSPLCLLWIRDSGLFYHLNAGGVESPGGGGFMAANGVYAHFKKKKIHNEFLLSSIKIIPLDIYSLG